MQVMLPNIMSVRLDYYSQSSSSGSFGEDTFTLLVGPDVQGSKIIASMSILNLSLLL
jgi:hypothetical protein